MSEQPKSAGVFTTAGSQAVRLPAEFRFDGDRVFIRRDERTGDVKYFAERTGRRRGH